MSNSNDESTGQKFDRRTIIGSALAMGGLSALGAAAMPQPASGAAFIGEREWARTLARHVADQLPEAARQIPGLGLSPDQIEQLRKAFENTLVTNMGCEVPPPR